MTHNEGQDELLELRLRIGQLKEEARKNEGTWRRAQQRESALLDAEDLATLLAELTSGLRSSHRLEATSIALIDPEHEIRHLLADQDAADKTLAQVLFVDAMDELPPQVRKRERPWLGPYAAADHARLFGTHSGIASVALLPLYRRNRAVGSLNFASRDSRRFTKAHATDFLHHLGVIAAFCLENALNQAKLIRVGSTDLLTGWHNRRYLDERLNEEVARAARDRSPLACVMIDVDHFKCINDDHGHLVGDEVLRAVAQRIGEQVRSSDISARYGGEEFIIVLPYTGLETAMHLAERIRIAVSAAPFEVGMLDTPLTVSVSVGLAELRLQRKENDHARLCERLVAEADAALYEAKLAGRNAVVAAQNIARRRAR